MIHRGSVGGGEVYGVVAKSQEEASRLLLREVNRATKTLLANQKTKTKTKERKRGGRGGGGGGGRIKDAINSSNSE